MVKQNPFIQYPSTLLRHWSLPSLSGLMLFIMLSLFASTTWAIVTATANRTVLTIDETLLLEIKQENASGEPDLTPLERNFQIMGRSQSQNYSFINGRSSQTRSWHITLLPKTTGEVIVPAITVGKEKTQPLHLVVHKQSKTPGLDGKDVFLKIEFAKQNKQTYFVQQQILAKVKLFHRVRFTNASLTELQLKDTVVEKLGNETTYATVIGNHRYNVVERNYAIYPQQSGKLNIPSLTFTGNIEISQNFSLFSRPGRQVVSRTKEVNLTILPIPSNYTGQYWLPAEKLDIESDILEDTKEIKAGEAITRHLVIRATGLLGSQLPALSIPSSSQIKTYPDKEKLDNQLVGGNVVGSRRDTIAIIPLKPGIFSLPEIKIDWWNTRTNQQETATIPAQQFTALGNPDITLPKQPVPEPSKPVIKKTAKVDKAPVTETSSEDIELTKNLWFWVSLGLIVIWLTTLMLFLSQSKKNKNKKKASPSKDKILHEKYLQRLYQSCQSNDATQATTALVKWAKIYFDQPLISGVSQVIDLIHFDKLVDALNTLESSQYSANKSKWNGKALSQAIKEYLKEEKQQQNNYQRNRAFKPLNP